MLLSHFFHSTFAIIVSVNNLLKSKTEPNILNQQKLQSSLGKPTKQLTTHTLTVKVLNAQAVTTVVHA